MKYIKALPYVIIVILCLMLGTFWLKNNKLNQDLLTISALNEVTLQELDTEVIKHSSTIKLLKKADDYSIILEQQIAELKVRPDKIKYVIRTETILEAGPVITVKDIPKDYIFRLANGIAVAAIKSNEIDYNLLTYTLKFKGQVAIAENKTSVSVQVASSEKPEAWVEVPVELTAINTQKRTTIEPHIGIGITVGYPEIASGALWGTLVHFPKGLDLGGAALLFNNTSVQAGFIPIAYNLGEPLPVLTNIWLAPMVTINLKGQPGGSLLIGGKL